MAELPETTDVDMATMEEEFHFTQFDNESLDLLALAVLASDDFDEKTFKKQNPIGVFEAPEAELDSDPYGWAYLPEILLEDIFTYLTPKYRHVASQVCSRWYRMFYSPRVWQKFVLDPTSLTRREHYNWNRRVLVPRKAQMCLSRIGSYFKHIVIEPIPDYYNLHQFMRILGSFLDFNGESAMPLLSRFEFRFACETHGVAEYGTVMQGSIIHGTGGQILEQLIWVMTRVKGLEELTLNNLLLENKDAPEILRVIWDSNSETLYSLELLNFTKSPFPILIVAQFWSLDTLSLSPNQLDEEVVLILASTCITDLRIIQNRYTQSGTAVSADAWKELRRLAPYVSVRLEVRGATNDNLLIQPHAPVTAVVFSTPRSRLASASIVSVCDHYSETLTAFVQEKVPKISGSRSFHIRGDTNLLMLANKCRYLKTVIINDRISTSTALLVAHQLGKSCERLVLRKNAIIKRCDWPKSPNWTHDFYGWLQSGSRCYDKMAEQISQRLGRKWQPLSDREFKKIKV